MTPRAAGRAVAGSRDPGDMGADEPLEHEHPGHEPPEHEPPEHALPGGEPMKRQIQFVLEADRLKTVARQSRITDGSRPENSAEHSWHWP